MAGIAQCGELGVRPGTTGLQRCADFETKAGAKVRRRVTKSANKIAALTHDKCAAIYGKDDGFWAANAAF
jgi:hypothetical protein